ncbi:BLUF domain-containing protein [Aurantiacibacter sp. MUD11]|uniref:BLUF domain-containing protein n=1 Tax=Aurantiacibacter sp. MUD11 TaxID=3003265 RepID=UPI0022AABDA2|nr:BLUF domain-containing protein [Aurantiacibacter sp. MUD11]WAT17659.1 BLUF domain-containing protein [Aurantiacibacter sp. MUD11]
MLSLIYVSVASAGLTAADVTTLAERAAANNAKHDVTGMLAYNSQSFMQLLEGDGAHVLSIMRRIEQDDRHGSITYIRQHDREHRECPDWSMRSLVTPMTGIGSANVFTKSLPEAMDLDTKILFTSFASTLTEEQAAQYAEREQSTMWDLKADND